MEDLNITRIRSFQQEVQCQVPKLRQVDPLEIQLSSQSHSSVSPAMNSSVEQQYMTPLLTSSGNVPIQVVVTRASQGETGVTQLAQVASMPPLDHRQTESTPVVGDLATSTLTKGHSSIRRQKSRRRKSNIRESVKSQKTEKLEHPEPTQSEPPAIIRKIPSFLRVLLNSKFE